MRGPVCLTLHSLKSSSPEEGNTTGELAMKGERQGGLTDAGEGHLCLDLSYPRPAFRYPLPRGQGSTSCWLWL